MLKQYIGILCVCVCVYLMEAEIVPETSEVSSVIVRLMDWE